MHPAPNSLDIHDISWYPPTVMDTKTHHRYLTATLDPAAVREETLEGSPYLVVPVVSLRGDIVISARGASSPEFVPAAVIEASVEKWDDQPVVADHPVADDNPALLCGVNDPAVTDAGIFGKLASTTFDGDLHHEAWLDVARAAELGGLPQQVVDNARAGTPTEVSVGVGIGIKAAEGVAEDGQRYACAWTHLEPDHLAIMPHAVGACSMEAGCGMRTAMANESPLRPLIRQLQLSQEVASRQLWEALFTTVPGLLWIEQTKDDHVIYVTETVNWDLKFWFQDYVITDDDKVELVGDPRPATPSPSDTTFVALTGDDNLPKETPIMCDTPRAATIRSLIDSDATQFTAEDSPILEGLDDSMLAKLMPAVEVAPEVDPAEVTTPAEAPAALLTEPPAGMVMIPETDLTLLMESANAYQAGQVAAVDNVVAQLRAAKTTFTDGQLRAMSLPTLETMYTDLATAQEQTPPPARLVTYAGYAGRQATAHTPPAPRPYDTPAKEVN